MYENLMKVRPDSLRVTWSHPLTYLCLTNIPKLFCVLNARFEVVEVSKINRSNTLQV